MAEVETTPVTEETPMEEQAPAEAPATEEKKEMTTEAEVAPKKSVFASLCGCFGGKSAVVEDKAVVEEEPEKPAEDKPTEDKPTEDKE